MKILVIGGCGFIGSHLVDRLLEHGHSVRVFDRQPERFRKPLKGVEYQFGNFGDRMAIIDALSGVDAVAHLVSTTFPGTADLDPIIDVQDNLVGTLALLDAMIGLEIYRLLFLSSGGTVYGPPEVVPIPETHPLRPINSYGIVKCAIEHYLGMYQRKHGLNSIAIRASNPYGSRQSHTGVQGVISTFLSRLKMEEPVEIWGDGSVVRDYLHVSDLAEVCALAIVSDKTGAYNAGSGVGMSINDILTIVQKVAGKTISPNYKPSRSIDVERSVLDVSRTRDAFNWECKVSLEQGISEAFQWIKQH